LYKGLIKAIQDTLTSPKSIPFLWGIVISLFLFTIALTNFTYHDYVTSHNERIELQQDIMTLSLNDINLSSENIPREIIINNLPMIHVMGWNNGTS